MKKRFYLFSLLILNSIVSIGQHSNEQKGKKVNDGKAVTVKDVQTDKIMLLNAYNFDFGSSSLNSNYVAHLNLFAPSLKYRLGFNTGIMKINYNERDTTVDSQTLIRENVLINPFDTIGPGLKYLKQFNSYKTERKNTIWSFYIQPTFEITEPNGDQHIYLHAHLELLSSNWSSTTTINNVKQDTGIYNLASSRGFVVRTSLSNTSTYNIKSLSGYFGLGLTFDLKPWDGGTFFFQPTIGICSNKPSPTSLDINSNIINSNVGKTSNVKDWNSFYLVRGYYTHVLSTDATIIVGIDVRGLLPLYSPQYAAYVGLNLSLKSILSLINGDKSK